jgi:hypothetical protein
MRKHADRAGRGALSHCFTGKLACRFRSRNAASSAPGHSRAEALGAPLGRSERARVRAPGRSERARAEAPGAPPGRSERARVRAPG